MTRARGARTLLLGFTCFLTSPGCPEPPIGCRETYLGSEGAPIEMELFYLGEDLLPHELAACGPLDIVQPPQGGRVLFVGVRARNLDPCNTELIGALRDPRDGSLLGVESRTTNFTPSRKRPGWGETSSGGDATDGFRYVANIPVCPNMSAPPRDVQQQLGILEIDLNDKRGKKGQLLQPVFPRCAQRDSTQRAMCECLCQADYSIAKCTNVTMFPDSPDAGACELPTSDAGDGGDGGDTGDAKTAPDAD